VPPKVKIEGQPTLLGRFLVILGLIIGLVLVADIIWLSASPKVIVEGSGASNTANLNSYEQGTKKILSNSLTSRTKVSIDLNKIEKSILNEFPELSDATIVLPVFGHTPTIYLQIAQPILVLRSHYLDYLLDSSGKIVEITPASQPSSLPLVINQANLTYQDNQQALSNSDTYFIQYVNQQLNLENIHVLSYVLVVNTREVDANIQGTHYYVKFNLENAPQQQVGTYLATRQYLIKSNITPAQYIDARVPGRSYFK